VPGMAVCARLASASSRRQHLFDDRHHDKATIASWARTRRHLPSTYFSKREFEVANKRNSARKDSASLPERVNLPTCFVVALSSVFSLPSFSFRHRSHLPKSWCSSTTSTATTTTPPLPPVQYRAINIVVPFILESPFTETLCH